MKLTNRTIIESLPILQKVEQKQLPAKISYAISKNLIKLQAELKAYDIERKKLIDRYAETDADGKLVFDADGISAKFKDSDAKAAWQENIDAVLDEENEVDIHKIALKEFIHLDELHEQNTNCQYGTFSPAELRAIAFMIDEA